MSCHQISTNDGAIHGWLCLSNIFKYPHDGKDYYFEYHRYLGPIPVRKRDFEPRSTIPTGFWKMIAEFDTLSLQAREEFKVYG